VERNTPFILLRTSTSNPTTTPTHPQPSAGMTRIAWSEDDDALLMSMFAGHLMPSGSFEPNAEAATVAASFSLESGTTRTVDACLKRTIKLTRDKCRVSSDARSIARPAIGGVAGATRMDKTRPRRSSRAGKMNVANAASTARIRSSRAHAQFSDFNEGANISADSAEESPLWRSAPVSLRGARKRGRVSMNNERENSDSHEDTEIVELDGDTPRRAGRARRLNARNRAKQARIAGTNSSANVDEGCVKTDCEGADEIEDVKPGDHGNEVRDTASEDHLESDNETDFGSGVVSQRRQEQDRPSGSEQNAVRKAKKSSPAVSSEWTLEEDTAFEVLLETERIETWAEARERLVFKTGVARSIDAVRERAVYIRSEDLVAEEIGDVRSKIVISRRFLLEAKIRAEAARREKKIISAQNSSRDKMQTRARMIRRIRDEASEAKTAKTKLLSSIGAKMFGSGETTKRNPPAAIDDDCDDDIETKMIQECRLSVADLQQGRVRPVPWQASEIRRLSAEAEARKAGDADFWAAIAAEEKERLEKVKLSEKAAARAGSVETRMRAQPTALDEDCAEGAVKTKIDEETHLDAELQQGRVRPVPWQASEIRRLSAEAEARKAGDADIWAAIAAEEERQQLEEAKELGANVNALPNTNRNATAKGGKQRWTAAEEVILLRTVWTDSLRRRYASARRVLLASDIDWGRVVRAFNKQSGTLPRSMNSVRGKWSVLGRDKQMGRAKGGSNAGNAGVPGGALSEV
jgi:hypothetical protein